MRGTKHGDRSGLRMDDPPFVRLAALHALNPKKLLDGLDYCLYKRSAFCFGNMQKDKSHSVLK